jgi:histidine phosphotransferase ChpT
MRPHAASLRLSELLATRLCHDLGGTVGVISAALDLAEDEPGAAVEALAIARSGAHALTARLRLLRAAWGLATTPLSLADIAALTQAIGCPERPVRVDMTALHGPHALPPNAGRLIINLLLLAAEALPRGGSVRLAGRTDAEVSIAIEGAHAVWPDGLATWLGHPAAALSTTVADPEPWRLVRTLQGPLAALLAEASGLGLSIINAKSPSEPQALLLCLAPQI